MTVHIEIEGLQSLRGRLGEPVVQRAALRRMGDAVAHIEAGAKLNAPKDMGKLAQSITSRAEPITGGVIGTVGSNLKYAPFMEYGTGLLSDHPTRRSGKRHFPPPAALARWCYLHGMAGAEYLVARAIWRRGGLKPRRYLRGAFEERAAAVVRILGQIPGDVKRMLGL